VKDLLIRGAEINGADTRGRTPLVAAAYAGQLDVARYLVQTGADVNLVDGDGLSAYLVTTSELGAEVGDDLLVVMLNGGARVSATDPDGRTGVIRAAGRGYDQIVRRLLSAGAPVDAVDDRGRSALHAAILDGDCSAAFTSTVEVLVRGGADVDLPTADGTRPLALARDRGCADIADVLRGADARP
jgi:ankyrin repeat protein